MKREREAIMQTWDEIASMLRSGDTSSTPRDIFESILDSFLEVQNDTKLQELCKCLTKTPEWKYHKQYCPVWKNGRIAELEKKSHRIVNESIEAIHDLSANNEVLKGRVEELEDFLKHVVYLKEEDYDYARDDHMIIRNIIPRIKELIKSET